MVASNFFYEVSEAEKGGFGIWYEYVVKSKLFEKFKKSKRVLVFGLPEKYSIGLDTLWFAKDSKLDVVDKRISILNEYNKFAKQFSRNVTSRCADLKTMTVKEKYDLLISTEVLQTDLSLMKKIKELSKISIVFVPNSRCYAHPTISKLNSLSLKQLESLGKKYGMRVIDSGYIDCPPWPSGAELPKGKDKPLKEGILLKLVKKILTKLTPFFIKFDKFYPTPIKEINSHMVYCIFKNE